MRAWKVASGEIANAPMLDRMASTGKPIMMSSGMSGLDEIRWAMDRVRNKVSEVSVMQCTTAYPCPPEKIGLNMLDVLRRDLRLPSRPVGSFRHDLSRVLQARPSAWTCSKST